MLCVCVCMCVCVCVRYILYMQYDFVERNSTLRQVMQPEHRHMQMCVCARVCVSGCVGVCICVCERESEWACVGAKIYVP